MFLNVTLKKINDLIKREDFKEIAFIDDKNVTILFDNRCCNISSFGRVTWDDGEIKTEKDVLHKQHEEYTIQDRQTDR